MNRRPPPDAPVTTSVSASKGMVYIADAVNHRVNMLDMQTGKVVLVAGRGVRGYSEGSFLDAQFDEPRGVCVDNRGFVYVADYGAAYR